MLQLHAACLQELMRDPVSAADGLTYERVAIRRWLAEHDRSPMTGHRLSHKDLVPNRLLRRFLSGKQQP